MASRPDLGWPRAPAGQTEAFVKPASQLSFSCCLILLPSPDRPSPERAPREPSASPSPSQGQGAENHPTRGIKPSWASVGGQHPGSGGSLQAAGAFRLNSNLFQQTQSGHLISASPPASYALDGPCRCWDQGPHHSHSRVDKGPGGGRLALCRVPLA